MAALGEKDAPAPTADVVRLSEAAIAKGSNSFATAARLFPTNTRADAVMLYAWCRHADDVIDGQDMGHDQKADYRAKQAQHLVTLKEQTMRSLDGEHSDDPVFEALRQVVYRNEIPHIHPMELLNGFEMDVRQRVYKTPEDLLEYCYHVAGVVGVMMAMIMGVREQAVLDRATDLGIAFQLTNIARDIVDDARADRTYVPSDWLEETAIGRLDATDTTQWPALHGVAIRLLDMAEPYYDSAFGGIKALPWRSAWAIAAARRIYRDIGRKLREEGPNAWKQRISTSKGRKLCLLLMAAGDVVAARYWASDVKQDRTGLYRRPGRSY